MGNTNINVDEELKQKAKEVGINISALTEKAIKDKLGQKEVQIRDNDKCFFCGRIEKKATAQNPIGLTWLYPDMKWICDTCLRSKIRHIPVRQT